MFANVIDQAIVHGVTGTDGIVPFGVRTDSLQRLSRMFGQNPLEPFANLQDLPGVNADIRRLSLKAAKRLVEQDPRVRDTGSVGVVAAA